VEVEGDLVNLLVSLVQAVAHIIQALEAAVVVVTVTVNLVDLLAALQLPKAEEEQEG
jgi:hypothetical protein